ncbi:hypothetical protein GCM10017784_28130 [Deinococcus indicus]|nr:hypothetical protein GCM10017784_28130 [Deinococcus indicus]
MDLSQIRLGGILLDPGAVLHPDARVSVTLYTQARQQLNLVSGHFAETVGIITTDSFDGADKGQVGHTGSPQPHAQDTQRGVDEDVKPCCDLSVRQRQIDHHTERRLDLNAFIQPGLVGSPLALDGIDGHHVFRNDRRYLPSLRVGRNDRMSQETTRNPEIRNT